MHLFAFYESKWMRFYDWKKIPIWICICKCEHETADYVTWKIGFDFGFKKLIDCILYFDKLNSYRRKKERTKTKSYIFGATKCQIFILIFSYFDASSGQQHHYYCYFSRQNALILSPFYWFRFRKRSFYPSRNVALGTAK